MFQSLIPGIVLLIASTLPALSEPTCAELRRQTTGMSRETLVAAAGQLGLSDDQIARATHCLSRRGGSNRARLTRRAR